MGDKVPGETDLSGAMVFFNERSKEWWRMREALDPAKSGAFPGVKGSTSAFFSDDRTVVAAHCIAPDSSTR